jgi:hypothetical protein
MRDALYYKRSFYAVMRNLAPLLTVSALFFAKQLLPRKRPLVVNLSPEKSALQGAYGSPIQVAWATCSDWEGYPC